MTTGCKRGIIELKEGDNMSELKTARTSRKLTQKQASEYLGVSLRSYKDYENNEAKRDTRKYRAMVSELEKIAALDEEHGILTMTDIKKACKDVLCGYQVKYCVLFGSYAKGRATEHSDVDLLISTDITGLRFYGIAERLREALHKKVDLLDLRQLTDNRELLDEILRDGVRVYEQSEK